MEYGLCSIIVPVYNVKDYLDECFKSILRQSYKNYEVIIVDDGSTDGSSEICDYYANNYLSFKVIHEKNAGVSCARNAGLKTCRGDFISFLDPDDIIEDRFLSDMISCIQENKVEISCCTYYRIKNSDKISGKTIGGGYRTVGIESFKLMLGEDQFTTSVWNKVYKREAIFKDASCFNEFEAGLKIGEDEKWLLSLFEDNSISVWYLNAPLYGWRLRDNSALKGAQGLTASRLDNLKTQEFVLDKAISMNDRGFMKIARIKLYKEAFNICRECYKVNDSKGLKYAYSKLRGCRLDYYRSTLNGNFLKKLVWEYLLWTRVKNLTE